MNSFVLHGWDLVMILTLEAILAVMVTYGAIRAIDMATAPSDAAVAPSRPTREDLAREAEFRRLADFEATIEDRREAVRVAERRDQEIKEFAEQFLAEQLEFTPGTPIIWLRGESRVHARPHGWVVEGITLETGNIGFWSVEIALLGNGAQGTAPQMEGRSVVWNLHPVKAGDRGAGTRIIVKGERDPDWPRLIFRD